MSIFEDTLEVWWNATNTVEGSREVGTIAKALNAVAAEPKDVAIVLDWESVYEISKQLDVMVPIPDHVVREHVELDTQRIGHALDTKATIHGVQSGQAFGLVMNPHSVRYDNTVGWEKGVVGIEWVIEQ